MIRRRRRRSSGSSRRRSGGIGPRLAGGRVVERFPDAADQVAVVTEGSGGMPAFSGKLTDDEIAAVVEYTRAVLAGG